MEARWKPEYFRRKEMLKTLELPTISETKEHVGLPLSTIIFEACHPELKKEFGLAPYLEGPTGDLWISPSDLLQGKVAVTVPPTKKHMYALTFQAVLDVGSQVEHKLVKDMRISKQTAVKELVAFLSSIFETEKAELLAALRKEEKLKYGSQLNNLRTYYDDKIRGFLWECYEQIAGLEQQMMSKLESTNVHWRERIENEIQETVSRLSGEFLEKMRLQEQILVNIFTKHIRTIKDKQRCAIDFERKKCAEKIKEVKHKLHCRNVADLMYLLCKERRRYKKEKNDVKKHYLERVRKLKSTSNQETGVIKNLTKLKKKRTRQIKVRERCLIEILRQYQKFIYFALKAVPTQGEFLLNINRLIKYELEDYCLPKEVSKITKKVEPETDLFDYGIGIEEFLESSHSLSEEEFECSDVLPALYYEDKMYVREDFRDMFFAGLQIDRKHPLWNPDVEELLNIFKKVTCQIEKVKSHISSVHSDSKGNSIASDSRLSTQIQTLSPGSSPASTPPRRLSPAPHAPMTQTTHGKTSLELEQEEKEIIKMSLGESENKETKPSVRMSKTESIRSQSLTGKIGTNPESQSRLTLARDSVILTLTSLERKSIQGISKTAIESLALSGSEKNGLAKITQDEREIVEDVEEMEYESEIKPKASKIVLACDSVELIKSRLDLVADKDQSVEKGTKRKSQLTFSPRVSIADGIGVAIPSTSKPPQKGKPLRKPLQHLLHGSKKVTPARKAVKVVPKSTARVTARSVRKGIVVGVRKEKTTVEIPDIFTNERITNLVNNMKESPSLLRLFTPCHK